MCFSFLNMSLMLLEGSEAMTIWKIYTVSSQGSVEGGLQLCFLPRKTRCSHVFSSHPPGLSGPWEAWVHPLLSASLGGWLLRVTEPSVQLKNYSLWAKGLQSRRCSRNPSWKVRFIPSVHLKLVQLQAHGAHGITPSPPRPSPHPSPPAPASCYSTALTIQG